MSGVAQELLSVLKSIFPEKVFLHEPYFRGNEWTYVKECLDTAWVSSVGKYVDLFEERLAAFHGVKRAVACVNGTAALEICLKLAGVRAGDEVLMPALTFAATANAAAYLGAVPHFVDSEERTLGLDPAKLAAHLERTTERRDGVLRNKATGAAIRAVVPVHIFGHPVDLDPLIEVCSRFGLTLVEDAAESIGSRYKGRRAGSFGRLAALSFNGNKIVTTGGGGAILTDDEELGKLAKHLTTTAKVPHAWEYRHDMTGYNYRLPNLNAALGCAQLEQLPSYLESKRALARRYEKAFAGFKGARFFKEQPFAESNYWLNAVLLDENLSHQRDEVLKLTNEAGVMTRPAWTLMHRLPMYAAAPRSELAVAESLERRIINVPSSVFLGEKYGQA